MAGGDWQQWDVDGVAEGIEEHWRASSFEVAHRAALGDLCARYVTSRELRVLEIGCGTGRVYEQLVPRLLPADGYLGVDISGRMLAIARKKFPHGRFHQGDGSALALADGTVDYALAFEVLGHLPEIQPLFRELGRVSRRGFLFTVWPATEEEGVVDRHEQHGPARFLHRRYPSSRLMSDLAAALPEKAHEVEISILDFATWAYVVQISPRS